MHTGRVLLGAVVTAAVVMGCGSDSPRAADPLLDSATSSTPDVPPGASTTDHGGVPADAASSNSSFVVVPAPSLDGNLLGDPAELEVAVWLPSSYETSAVRYPVVYYLAGFGESASTATIGSALERLIEQGEAPEMILVGVDGINSLGGSFYVDSPVTGKWAQAVHRDLVTYIDGNYRSLPRADARGVAGFSMGGFGAIDLAMRHPDVFGCVYALSPGLLAPGGLETTQMFADDDVVAEFLALQDSGIDDAATVSADLRFSIAYGAAFAPDPDAGYPYVAYPYTEIGSPRDESIWARWDAGYGGVAAEVEAFENNLLDLRGIALDYGTSDQYTWIPAGVAHLADQLAEHSIPVQVTAHDGGHGSIGARAEAVMFPFLADVLEVEP